MTMRQLKYLLISNLYLCSFNFDRAYRTALCKSKRGGFKDTHPDDLLAPVLKVCFLVFEVCGLIYCLKNKYNLFFFLESNFLLSLLVYITYPMMVLYRL